MHLSESIWMNLLSINGCGGVDKILTLALRGGRFKIRLSKHLDQQQNRRNRGLFKNPLFYFLVREAKKSLFFFAERATKIYLLYFLKLLSFLKRKYSPDSFKRVKMLFCKITQILSLNKDKKPSRFIGGSFYFGLLAFFLWSFPFFNFDGLAKLDNLKEGDVITFNSFFLDVNNLKNNDLFFSQNNQSGKESPDLKIIQDSFVYGISTPRILNTQTLGDILGETSHAREGEIVDYIVEPGDTIASVAKHFGISATTIALANNLSTNSALKVGQNLVILPVDGLLHVVRSGDTVSSLAKTYKAIADDINYFNNLANENDIYTGDVLMIPYGKMPAKPAPSTQIVTSDNYFILVSEGRVTQGLHYYNAIDVANNCGTPVHAAASGVIQKVRFDYRYGNFITILHGNGTTTYYGHLQTMFVRPGENITVGDRIALMGRTGTNATGCHVHLGVTGAQNPLAKYARGTTLKFK